MLVISLVGCLNSWVLEFELRFHGLFCISLHCFSPLACEAMLDSDVWVQTSFFYIYVYAVQSVCVYRVQVAVLFLWCCCPVFVLGLNEFNLTSSLIGTTSTGTQTLINHNCI